MTQEEIKQYASELAGFMSKNANRINPPGLKESESNTESGEIVSQSTFKKAVAKARKLFAFLNRNSWAEGSSGEI